MASESTDEGVVMITLPADLDDWLEERATELDVDRETLLVQLLASYRTTAELDGDTDADQQLQAIHQEAIAETIDEELTDTLDDRVAAEVEAQIQTALESTVVDQLSEATDAVRQQLSERIDAAETDYTRKIEDVRERVVQVKRETDQKAAADHDHEEFDRLQELSRELADLQTTVDDLESTVSGLETTVTDQEVAVGDINERVDEVTDRLQTVAWVVNDLRETQESTDGLGAVDRIKRAAGKADIERAKCGNCGNGVHIALLTDPECPHCEATVTNVDPADGFFSKPTLVVASQLESGED